MSPTISLEAKILAALFVESMKAFPTEPTPTGLHKRLTNIGLTTRDYISEDQRLVFIAEISDILKHMAVLGLVKLSTQHIPSLCEDVFFTCRISQEGLKALFREAPQQ